MDRHEYMKAYRQQRRVNAICLGCGRPNDRESGYCTSCADRKRLRAAELRWERSGIGLCNKCGKEVERHKRSGAYKYYCNSCAATENALDVAKRAADPEIAARQLAAAKRSQRKIRAETLNAYGGFRCVCCGETRYEFLQIDHINNDGAEHRKVLRSQGTSICNWLKKRGFPPGYQVLCANCNIAKGKYGECPHERERREQWGMDSGPCGSTG